MRRSYFLFFGLVVSALIAWYAAVGINDSEYHPVRDLEKEDAMYQLHFRCAAFYLARQSFFPTDTPEHIDIKKHNQSLMKIHADIAYNYSSNRKNFAIALETEARTIQNQIIAAANDTKAITAIINSREPECIREILQPTRR